MSKLSQLIHLDRLTSLPVGRADINNYLANMQDEMNRVFNRFLSAADVYLTDWDKSIPSAPAIDIVDEGKNFAVKAELPGFDLENLEVEVAGGFLTIRGKSEEKSEQKQNEKGGAFIRREISSGFVQRTISLPETAETGGAEATFRNGILTVKIPKNAAAMEEPKKLSIKKAA